jgi:hypothetical protein
LPVRKLLRVKVLPDGQWGQKSDGMGESGWVGCIRMFLRVADPRSGWQAGRRQSRDGAIKGPCGWVSGDIEDEHEHEED